MQMQHTQHETDTRHWPHPAAPLDAQASSHESSPITPSGMPMRRQASTTFERAAMALGVFSLGLGLAELLAPKGVSRGAGVADSPQVVRALGAREIASGLAILGGWRRAGLWSRVGGDVMDLALLGIALSSAGTRRNRAALVTAAVAGVAVLDLLSSRQANRLEPTSDSVHLVKTIAVNRPPDEAYRFWRDFANFPRFMKHLESVQVTSDQRSHWVATGPAGKTFEWDAEIVSDEPNEMLAWRSLENADVDHAGYVRFERAPGGRGTLVHVEMQYRPPAGQLGRVIAKLFGEEPEQQLQEDLRRFKQMLETGEIPTTVGQPAGRRSMIARLMRKGTPG